MLPKAIQSNELQQHDLVIIRIIPYRWFALSSVSLRW